MEKQIIFDKNKKNMKERDALLCASLFLIIATDGSGGESAMYLIGASIAFPLLFFLLGSKHRYSAQYINIIQWVKRNGMMLLVPYFGISLINAIIPFFRRKHQTFSGFAHRLESYGNGVFEAHGAVMKNEYTVEVLWVLLSLFLVITCFELIHRSMQKYMSRIIIDSIVVLTSVILGVLIGTTRMDLPMSMDVSTFGLAFYGIGDAIDCLWDWDSYRWRNWKQNIFFCISTLVCGVIWLYSLKLGSIVDLRNETGLNPISLLGTCTGIATVVMICHLVMPILIKYCNRIINAVSFIGSYAIAIICILSIDRYLWWAWYRENWIVTLILRSAIICLLFVSWAIATDSLTRGKCFGDEKLRSFAQKSNALYLKQQKYFSVIFYSCFGILYFIGFFRTTMYVELLNDAQSIFVEHWTHFFVVIAFVLGAFATSAMENKKQLASLYLFLIATMICYQAGNYYMILLLPVLIMASYGRSSKRILIIAFVIGIFWMCAAMFGAHQGIIQDLYFENGRYHAFGIIYRTDFAAHLMYLCMIWAVLRNKSLMIADYVGMMAVGYFLMWKGAGGKMNVPLLFLFILLCIMKPVLERLISKSKVVKFLLNSIFIVCALVSYVAIACYSKLGPFLTAHNMDTLTSRLMLSWRAMDAYSFKLFGTFIPDVKGFLDIAYFRMPMLYGIVFFVLFMYIMTHLMRESTTHNRYILIVALFVIAGSAIIDHHLTEVFFDVFPLLAFAKYDIGNSIDESKKIKLLHRK